MGKKNSQRGSNLWAVSGRRPEPKYTADTDEDPLDHEFRLEDRAGESSGGSGAESSGDDDDMAVEMTRELEALAGERRTRAAKQQKVAHATRAAATPAKAAGSSTPHALISSYFTARTPVAASPSLVAAVDTTPTTAPAAPTATSIPVATRSIPDMPPGCCICLEAIDPQATGNMTLDPSHPKSLTKELGLALSGGSLRGGALRA